MIERIMYYDHWMQDDENGEVSEDDRVRVSSWADTDSPHIHTFACEATIFWVEYVETDLPKSFVHIDRIKVGDRVHNAGSLTTLVVLALTTIKGLDYAVVKHEHEDEWSSLADVRTIRLSYLRHATAK